MGDIPSYSKIEENHKKFLNQGFSNNLVFQVSQKFGLGRSFDVKAAVKCLKNNEGQIIFLGNQDFNFCYKSWQIQHNYITNINSKTKVGYKDKKYQILLKTNKENRERNYSASVRYMNSEINSKLALLSTKLINFWAVKPWGIFGVGFRIGYNYGIKQFQSKSIALWWSEKESSVALKYLNKNKGSLLKEGFATYASHKLTGSLGCAASLKLLKNHSADLKFCLKYDADKNKTIKIRAEGNGIFGLSISQKLNEFLKISVWHQFNIKAISNDSESISNLGFKLEIISEFIDNPYSREY